jgi:DNA polymerase-4
VTFQHDLRDHELIRGEVRRLARQVAEEITLARRPAARVVVKVRYAPFVTQTHGCGLEAATTDPAALERAALTALDRFTDDRPVRLLGVRAEFPA